MLDSWLQFFPSLLPESFLDPSACGRKQMPKVKGFEYTLRSRDAESTALEFPPEAAATCLESLKASDDSIDEGLAGNRGSARMMHGMSWRKTWVISWTKKPLSSFSQQ